MIYSSGLELVNSSTYHFSSTSSDKILPINEEDLQTVEREAETKRISLNTYDSWQSNMSNDATISEPTKNGSITTASSIDDDFQFFKISRQIPDLTWLEKETRKRAKDVQSMKSTQIKINEELIQIKAEVGLLLPCIS